MVVVLLVVMLLVASVIIVGAGDAVFVVSGIIIRFATICSGMASVGFGRGFLQRGKFTGFEISFETLIGLALAAGQRGDVVLLRYEHISENEHKYAVMAG